MSGYGKYEGKMKSYSLPYNRRSFGGDPTGAGVTATLA